MNKFVINLDRCKDRMLLFDNTWTRWEATDGKDLENDDPILQRMCSMWNINPMRS